MDETTIFQFFQSIRNPQLDLFSIFIDVLFSFEFLIILLIILFALKRDKESFSFLFSFILNGLLTFILKLIFCMPRPEVENVAGIIPIESYSFPSGHTSNAFFIAKFLSKKRRSLKYSFYAIAVIVALLRVYSGAHYPRDVIAGALVGYFSAFILLRFEKSIFALYSTIRKKLGRKGRNSKTLKYRK